MENIDELNKLVEYWRKQANKYYADAKYWQDAYFREHEKVERLSLDLGLKDQGYIE